MASPKPFRMVDVFGNGPFSGNPVAVVHDADDLSTEQMQAISAWTNLSECTFVVSPTDPAADYRLRIFCLERELPFAGHPTLGSARAWLDAGGTPHDTGVVVQECGVGLVRVRTDGDLLSFAAPRLLRSGPLEPDLLATVVDVLGISAADVVDAAWVDNGPGWIGVQLADADAVLAVAPDLRGRDLELDLGVVGAWPDGHDRAIEVRAFFTDGSGSLREDPVTGSLNASIAQWLTGNDRLRTPYTAGQGACVGRDGRVHVDGFDGELWIGGRTHVAVRGEIDAA